MNGTGGGIEYFPNSFQKNSGADNNLFNIQHESQCSDLLKTNGLNYRYFIELVALVV